MIAKLKELGFKTAPTLNNFIKKVKDLDLILEYVKFLDQKPKRTDFINYDSEGFQIENTPLFKGWELCEATSSEKLKVAKKGDNRIYFDTQDGVLVMSKTNACDQTTYNSLFIFFDGKLKLN
jgi:hypothetical protein